MYYTYVLRSLTYKTLYVGSSQNPLKRLREEHNRGKVPYTKARIPWELVYSETFEIRDEAMKIEKFWKTGQGRKYIQQRLQEIS